MCIHNNTYLLQIMQIENITAFPIHDGYRICVNVLLEYILLCTVSMTQIVYRTTGEFDRRKS